MASLTSTLLTVVGVCLLTACAERGLATPVPTLEPTSRENVFTEDTSALLPSTVAPSVTDETTVTAELTAVVVTTHPATESHPTSETSAAAASTVVHSVSSVAVTGTTSSENECDAAFTKWSPWTEKAANIKNERCGDRRRTRKVRNATLADMCHPQGWELTQFKEACAQLSREETQDAFQYYVIDRLFGWSNIEQEEQQDEHRRRRELDGFDFIKFTNVDKHNPLENCPMNKEQRPVDFLIMLDKSGSMSQGNYKQLRNSMANLVSKGIPSVEEDSTRVSLMTFAATTDLEFDFNTCRTKRCYRKSFKKYNHLETGGPTRMSLALEEAARIFTAEKGARTCSRKVILILTDGTAEQDNPTPAAQVLKNRDVEIFVMAISRRINENQLESVVSHPSMTHLYYMPNAKMVRRICKKLREATLPEEYLVEDDTPNIL